MAKTTVSINGNLGRDVETKTSKSGNTYSVLAVGSTPSKKNQSGEWENGETMWFNITVFGELNPFEFVKGTPVKIDGTLTVRNYVKKDGTPGYSLDVLADAENVKTVSKSAPKAQIPQSAPFASATAILDDMPF